MRTSLILAVTVSVIAAAIGGPQNPPKKPDLPDILKPDARYGMPYPWSYNNGYWTPRPILDPATGLGCHPSHLCSNRPPKRDRYPYIRPAQLSMGDNCWSTCGGTGGKCEACPAVETLMHYPGGDPFIHIQTGRCCRQRWDDNDPACHAVGCHWYHCCA